MSALPVVVRLAVAAVLPAAPGSGALAAAAGAAVELTGYPPAAQLWGSETQTTTLQLCK